MMAGKGLQSLDGKRGIFVTGLQEAITNAQAGKLTLSLNTEEFDKLITACDVYIDALRDLRDNAVNVSVHPLGFSEAHLDSGKQLAQAFQRKAAGGPNSAESSFLSHIDQVEEMKSLFVAIRSSIMQTDAGNAHKFDQHGR
ncbi:hypothetical protein [Mycobacteroides abscessus]|uniref:hypothetical protein n=1 Tax=Mycobacteroides abscessus TaxID=36809 RepID=UPI000241C788|nr:hypothetical protein [Mycobacteroides abscessus]EHM23320.1 hypothetical protein MBOL_06850 [Mycobacteroides abscessus subsp. bolletii BD]ORA22086.1 hypothetical protein BST18_24700 [Mycobacteroides abscessus subsp. bolletii]TPF69883.1 hypothetical protein XW60_04445 [Mycobacteroides abscessus subsp. bolletii]